MVERLTPARDPLQFSMLAELAEHFAPLGANLRLETNNEDIVSACRTSFGRYGVPAPSSSGAPILLRLLVDSSFNEAPPWPDPVFRGQGDIFYICVGCQNTAVANLGKGCAIGFISPAMARDQVFVRNIFIECLVLTMLTSGKAGRYTYAHASAVAKGDRGLIFSGPSQAGKTTLAFACARRGFQIVSDDVVYLFEEGDGVTVWGKPWHLRFLEDCARFFPELKQKAARLRFDGKNCVEVDVEELMPGTARPRCKAEAIFFLERASGPAGYYALESQEAIRLLSRDLVFDQPEVLERHQRHWLKVVGRGAYVLRYGEDLEAVVQLLETFLTKTRLDHGAS